MRARDLVVALEYGAKVAAEAECREQGREWACWSAVAGICGWLRSDAEGGDREAMRVYRALARMIGNDDWIGADGRPAKRVANAG